MTQVNLLCQLFLLGDKKNSIASVKRLVVAGILTILLLSVSVITHAQSLNSQGSLCTGNSVTLYIQPSFPCTTLTVFGSGSWTIPSGGSITYNSNYTQAHVTWSSSGSFTCRVSYSCSGGGSGSASLNVIIATTVAPSVSLSLSPALVCTSGSVTLTAAGVNGGSPSYSYYIDGILKQTKTTNTYLASGLSAGAHSAYVIMSSSLSCVTTATATSVTQNFTVTAPVSYTVAVSGPSIICASNPSGQFFANPSNSYGSLTYQWYQGGSPVGTGTSTFNATNLLQGQSVSCTVNSNYWCISSNSVPSNVYSVNVTSGVTPTVGVQLGSLSYCQGTSVLLTAGGSNIGGTPTYTWTINGSQFGAPSTSNTTTWTPGPGSYVVSVNVTGIGGTCLTATSASGSSPTITVYATTTVGSLTAIPPSFCNNGSVNLNVTGSNGGVTRYMVQSQDNGGALTTWMPTNSTPTVTTSPGIIRTYNFQAFVQNGACLELGTNNVVSTTVYYSNSMGALSVSTPLVCTNSGSANVALTLTSLTTPNASWQYQYSNDNGNSFTTWAQFSPSQATTQNFTMTATGIYNFQVQGSNSACAPVTSNQMSTSMWPIPQASVLPAYMFSGTQSSVNLSSSVPNTAFTITPQTATSTDVSGMPTSPFSGSTIAEVLTSTDGTNIGTANYSVTPLANGCQGPAIPATITVYPTPTIITPATTTLNRAPITLNIMSFYTNPAYTINWYGNGALVGTGSSFSVGQPGPYYATATVANISAPQHSGNTIMINGQFSAQNANFIVENTLLVDGTLPTTLMDVLPNTSLSQKVQYFDGLGRPIQTVLTQASPLQKDMLSTTAYDPYGRTFRKFLPFAGGNNGWMQYIGTLGALDANDNPAGPLQSFYGTTPSLNVASDTQPYSQTSYEPSPLNRPVQDFGPGADWYTGLNGATNPRSVSHDYRVYMAGMYTAGANVNLENIYDLSIVPSTQQSHTVFLVASNGFLPSNTLLVNVTSDENNNVVREYVDKLGRTIARKVQLTSTPNVYDDTQWTITYYVYDNFDRLRAVLQPQFVANISTYLSANQAIQAAMLKASAFQYGYDQRGRMKMKQLPGTDSVEMVYDPWDRLVLSRNGNERAPSGGLWAFIKYDVMNRPIMTGEYPSLASYSTMVTSVNGSARYESAAQNSIGYTYTNTFPSVSSTNILAVSYYDDYSFATNLGVGSAYNFTPITGPNFPTGNNTRTRGHPTGAQTQGLTSSQWVRSAIYYDTRYRAIQTVNDDHLGNKNIITKAYAGITTWVTASQLNLGTQMTSLTQTTYDQSGRPLQVTMTQDGGTPTILSNKKYNEIGQVIEKDFHSISGGAPYLQTANYSYNIRGWGTSMNNQLFSFQLNYQQSNTVASMSIPGQFNGNISSMNWSTNNLINPVVQKCFGFNYDPLNRLLNSYYAEGSPGSWTGNGNMYAETIGYDVNGNIKNLTRKSNFNGGPALVDNLSYSYPIITGSLQFGNQMATVDDGSSSYSNLSDKNPDYGFAEYTQGITEYAYDPNGNMTEDLNTGIHTITYSSLYNKPLTVGLTNVDGTKSYSVQYNYDGSGLKLRKIATGNGITTQNDYVGNVEFVNGNLAFVLTPEGRAVKNSAGQWTYEYFLKDHLGNTRSVFSYTNQQYQYTATMEPSLSSSEQPPFQNITPVRSTDFNNTAKSYLLPAPSSSAQVNGYLNKPIGPAITLPVTAGDVINVSVYSRYTTGISGTVPVIAGLASFITTAYGMTSGEAVYSAITSNIPTIAAGLVPNSGSPKAYLMYILFNSSYSAYQIGYQMVSSYSQVGFEKLPLSVTVPSGYSGGNIYIYVANETNSVNASSVYFDDMFVQQIKSTPASLQVTQTTDYYPSGLAMNPTGYNLVVPYANQYLYNGKELQNDFNNMRWLDYGARMYMPELATWSAADPHAENSLTWSPYSYAFDNPIRYVDPNGMDADEYVKGGYGELIMVGIGVDSEGQRYNSNGEAVNSYQINSPGKRTEYKRGQTAQQITDYVMTKNMVAILASAGQSGSDKPRDPFPRWMILAYLEKARGVKTGDNRILDYFKATDLSGATSNTAWCLAFVNWCLQEAGQAAVVDKDGHKSAWAPDIKDIAYGQTLKEPVFGAVVYVKGTYYPNGHASFFVYSDTENYYILGGNQHHTINIQKTPIEGHEWVFAYPSPANK